MLNVGVEGAKKIFFDRESIIDPLEKAAKANLSKVGAYTRRNAKGLFKKPKRQPLSALSVPEQKDFKRRAAIAKYYGKPIPKTPFAPSKVGEAPRNVTGRIKDFIFFVYDSHTRSVVIGPSLLNHPTGAPEVLEDSGTTTVSAGPDKGKIIFVGIRPYMQPAFDKARRDTDGVWKDSIKK